jgi:hypothetical protein
MAGPTSISVKQISTAAKTSVAKAIQQSKRPIPPATIFGYFPPHWLGVIVRPQLELTLAEAQQLAGDVHSGIAAEVPSVKGAKTGAMIADGNLTIGFAPPTDTTALVE